MELMKAVLTEDRFSDPDWIFERKLDGIRCVAIKDADGVRLRSRNDLDLGGRFATIADALAADPVADVVVDGEVVAFDGAQTSFSALQQRGDKPVFFYVFDILRVGGEDVTSMPRRERTATWVTPRLVAQIGFTEWTRDGRLRHPRFLGLRDDKAPQEVVREQIP
jgi:ATP-dependent DNA ligase